MNRQVFDLTGQKFGRLTVQSFDKSEKGNAKWNCICECGNEVSIFATHLKSGDTKSCGCLALEISKVSAEKNLHSESVKKKAADNREKKDRQDGVYVSALKRNIAENNMSGVKGVFWDKNRNRWRAVITLNGKSKWLGSFIHKEDAIEARKKAEEIYFAPILNKSKGRKQYTRKMIQDHVEFLRKTYSYLTVTDYKKLVKEKGYMSQNTIYRTYKSWKNVFPDKDTSTRKKMYSDEIIHKHVKFLKENYKYLTVAEYQKLAKEKGYMSFKTILNVYKKWSNIYPDNNKGNRQRKLGYSEQQVTNHVKYLKINYPKLTITEYRTLAKEKGYMSIPTILKVYKKWSNIYPDNNKGNRQRKLVYSKQQVTNHVEYLKINYPNLTKKEYKNLAKKEYKNLAKKENYMSEETILREYGKWSEIYPSSKKVKVPEQEVKDHVNFLRENYSVLTIKEYKALAKEHNYMSVGSILNVYGKWSTIFLKKPRRVQYSDEEIHAHVRFLRNNYPNISKEDYILLATKNKYMSATTIQRIYKNWMEVFPDGNIRKKLAKTPEKEIHKHVEFLRKEYGYMSAGNYTKLAKEKEYMAFKTILTVYKKWSNVFPGSKPSTKKNKKISDKEVQDHVEFLRDNYPNISAKDYKVLADKNEYMSEKTILRVYGTWKNAVYTN